MSNITHTQKVAAGMLLILCGTIAAYVMLYRHIGTLHSELAELERTRSGADAAHEAVLAEQQLFESTASERTELAQYLIPAADPTPFLGLLESLGKDAHIDVEVHSLEPDNAASPSGSAAKTQPAIPSVRVTLVVSGLWPDLYHFLALLEQLPYAVTVDHVALDIDETAAAGVWSGQIHLRGGLGS